MIDLTMPLLYCVTGRQGLKIYIDTEFPESYLEDKTLVGLEGEELEKALKKPFYTSKDLGIYIEYGEERYQFTIPIGYDWNGANVPPFAWLIIVNTACEFKAWFFLLADY